MEDARRDLARMRESPDRWRELAYQRGVDADGLAYDEHEVRRASVLWALQYDGRPDDLPLLRWLVEQEARCRREAPVQGLSEAAQLAGVLLAEHRRVEDVWLHWRLKQANFDTWCGYDSRYLMVAGVRATVDFVRASGHAQRDAVLECLLGDDGQPWSSEPDQEAWTRGLRAEFPTEPADEDPLTWAARARMVGDRALALDWVDRWSAGRPRTPAMLNMLRHQLAGLGEFAAAAGVQRELLALIEPGGHDRAFALWMLATLERQAGDHLAAWDALRGCRRELDDVDGWRQVGQGRMYVEELFQLAAVADGELAATVFAAAERQAPEVPGLPLVVWRAAVATADNVGDSSRAAHYRELRDAEQRRIETASLDAVSDSDG
jgi:hypothetical protein